MTLGEKLRANLSRPIPDLYRYILEKIVSFIWSRYLMKVGSSFHVCHSARIQGGRFIKIGNRFFAGPLLWLEAVESYGDHSYAPVILIGANVRCSDSAHISATTAVTIHDDVLIGSRVHITDHSHGRYSGLLQDDPQTVPTQRPLSQGRPVLIESKVWLGDGVVVLPGVTIGTGTIVGANSVVSRSLPSNVIAVGSPATPIRFYDAKVKSWLPLPGKPTQSFGTLTPTTALEELDSDRI